MTDRFETDILIVGAGIAGVGLAADLTGDYRVTIIEQESRPAYHSTGRSMAIFIRNYGNAAIRALSRASAPLFEKPDATLFPHPLISQRGVLFISDESGISHHNDLLDQADGLRRISLDEAFDMVPILRRDWVAAAAYEHDAQDIDVNALHEGWLRKARSAGAQLLTDCGLRSAERVGGKWRAQTAKGEIVADVIVNAAGAWADPVAQACGVASLGIQPMRRSIAVLPAPAEYDTTNWPLIDDSAERWYCKPGGGKLYVSPADEIPVEPHDAYVDDMILAEGLDRFEQAVDYPVTRVERSWAGLRSFAPDRTPVAGFAPVADGFFWLAGQGGYGMQTAPALSRLAGQLIRRIEPSELSPAIVASLLPDRFFHADKNEELQ
ncbi:MULTISPECIES: NAD(P)/FAD-dependent oxidoreductase [Mesorhizobium]|uniref:FAD-binding oxidoreductase n=1 Tax=Mesorhizobium denitrificans TaxID=2294114 RepID=A0A371XIU7_9HYPH|nr:MULTISPECIES: FAD-binding oxidoreductase [Mesorhizobium]RFC69158.1 FAD-binding oxidoreductase [Mesorhizobium denitrificans]